VEENKEREREKWRRTTNKNSQVREKLHRKQQKPK